MPDLPSITAALSGLKHAGDLINFVRTSEKALEQAELKAKLADAAVAVADARTQIAETQTIILERNEKIRDLENKLEMKSKLTFVRPYYMMIDGDKQDGPYCQKCYDADSKLIRLQTRGNGVWDCKACTGTYRDDSYVAPKPRVADGTSSWLRY